jgi:hypothetical protein
MSLLTLAGFQIEKRNNPLWDLRAISCTDLEHTLLQKAMVIRVQSFDACLITHE